MTFASVILAFSYAYGLDVLAYFWEKTDSLSRLTMIGKLLCFVLNRSNNQILSTLLKLDWLFLMNVMDLIDEKKDILYKDSMS